MEILFVLLLLGVAAFAYYMLKIKPVKQFTIEEVRQDEERRKKKQEEEAVAARRAQQAAPVQVQQQAVQPRRQQAVIEEPEDRNLTKAEMAREAKKQAKKDKADSERQFHEERRKREEEQAEKAREKELKEEEVQMKQEAIIQKQKEEEAKRKEDEYKRWAQQMEIVETGDKSSQETEESLSQRFVDYITLRKVVALEDLCSRFKMTNKEVIRRIKELESSGKLIGVIDDRGKYIYLRKNELENIMRFIRNEGKLLRTELVNECSRIVSIEPSAADKEKIKQEEDALVAILNKQLMQEESAVPTH